MDRKTILAMVLIAVIIILWPIYSNLISPKMEPVIQKKSQLDSAVVKPDSTKKTTVPVSITKEKVTKKDSVQTKTEEPVFWTNSPEKITTIKSNFFTAKISNQGGGSIKLWSLNTYKDFTGENVSFIQTDRNINVSFKYKGQIINLNKAIFSTTTADTFYDLTKNEKVSFDYILPFEQNKTVKHTLTFYKDRYDFDLQVQFSNFGDDITNNEYFVQWTSGLKITEKNHTEDLNYFRTNVYIGDAVDEFDISTQPQGDISFTGLTKWISSRTKYFVVFIIPQEKDGIGCSFSATSSHEFGVLKNKDYFLNLNMKFENNKTDSYKFYIGPTEYSRLNQYEENLAILLEWGWTIIKPLSKGIFWIFKFLYDIIPNYGIVIIIFALLVKILLYPLTHKSYVGMQKMKEVMPRQKELQKKYKDNPKKMQEELMKLYKEIGYNPLSGCLPVLLQMPILFPIYQVFNATIDLRQAPFAGWIHDLSVPDTVAVLHTGLPFIGDFNVNPLPIIMTILTFVQQKITPMTPTDDSDPAQRFNQKFMLYGMPILFFFIFNNFSSGLVMYWTIFNVLTMLQQYLMSKHILK